VWTVTTTGPKPSGDVTVMATLHQGNAIQYRILGQPQPGMHAVPAEPGLEEGYMWLMQRRPVFP
jgi:ABC-2 type transport system ATP-binding protein